MPLLEWLQATSFGVWVRESRSIWAYPSILTAHTIGLAVLVGANTVLNLRLLGVYEEAPIEPLESLFPLMWTGFGINAVSGLALFIADATKRATQPVFLVKMACIAFGVILIVLLRSRVFENPGGPVSESAQRAGRKLAVASLVCWISAITAGRLMAYFN